jgi:hypothetical protein
MRASAPEGYYCAATAAGSTVEERLASITTPRALELCFKAGCPISRVLCEKWGF